MKRYCKLGTQPYGLLEFDKELKKGDRLWIKSDSMEEFSEPIEVVVADINENCVFLSKI